jgi:hypothetical protein
MKPTAHENVRIEAISMDKLFIDPRWQREARPTQVRRAAQAWEEELCGTITVCKVGRRYHVADGQNRFLAKSLRYKDYPSRTMLCVVSKQHPAVVFEKLNEPRARTAAGYHAIFWIRKANHQRREVTIARVCKRNGINLTRDRKTGGHGPNCAALLALKGAYNTLTVAQFTLLVEILAECFNHGLALRDPFVEGVARFLKSTRHDGHTAYAKLLRSRVTADKILKSIAHQSNSLYARGVCEYLHRICK